MELILSLTLCFSGAVIGRLLFEMLTYIKKIKPERTCVLHANTVLPLTVMVFA